jgi:hypothetical protein
MNVNEMILKVRKNTRRGVELCFEKFFVSPKTEHTDQKLSETASEVIIRI